MSFVFKNVNLLITADKAYFQPYSQSQLPSGANAEKGYIKLVMKPASTSKFIQSLSIEYFLGRTNRILKIYNFLEENKECLNTLTALRSVFESSINPASLFAGFDFTQLGGDFGGILQKYIYSYQGAWAIYITTLYLTYINMIGGSANSKIFAPFELQNLINGDSLEGICRGFSVRNIDYLEPTSFVVGSLSGENPPLQSLQLLTPWYSAWKPFLSNTETSLNFQQSGVLTAALGLCGSVPDCVDEVRAVAKQNVVELENTLTGIQKAANTEIERVKVAGINSQKDFETLANQFLQETGQTLQQLGDLKTSLVERLNRESDKIISGLDDSLRKAIDDLIENAQNANNKINEKEKQIAEFTDENLSELRDSIGKVRDELEEISETIKANIGKICHHLKDNCSDLESRQKTLRDTCENTKKDIEEYCRNSYVEMSGKIKSCYENSEKRYTEQLDEMKKMKKGCDGEIKCFQQNLKRVLKDAGEYNAKIEGKITTEKEALGKYIEDKVREELEKSKKELDIYWCKKYM